MKAETDGGSAREPPHGRSSANPESVQLGVAEAHHRAPPEGARSWPHPLRHGDVAPSCLQHAQPLPRRLLAAPGRPDPPDWPCHDVCAEAARMVNAAAARERPLLSKAACELGRRCHVLALLERDG
eukprot:5642582-Pyramimonas_sp.AAC.1